MEKEAIKMFLGGKGLQMIEEIKDLLRRKFGAEAFGVEKLISALIVAVFAFYIFPNYVKPVIEEIIKEVVKK